MSSLFGQRQKQSAVVLGFLFIGMLFFVLRSDNDDPQAQVERMVKELVAAVEKKDLGPFRQHLSEDVRDEKGRNKEVILKILRVIYLRYPKISLNILALDAADHSNPNIMTADFTLLMGENILPTEKGNFNLTFRNEDDTWRIWEIEWEAGAGYGY